MRVTKAKRVRMKHGGLSAILDLVAREGLCDEVELKLKVAREQAMHRSGEEHSTKKKPVKRPGSSGSGPE